MISIGKIGGIEYYIQLAHEDYWFRENPFIHWGGSGCEALGLSGMVTSAQLEQLFAGFSPDGSRALVMNAGSSKRRIGWDVCASAPKSFSTLWSQSEPSDRHALEQIHDRVVEETIAHFEENAAWVRTGPGGHQFERAGVVVAVVRHGTSRDNSPNLHSHILLTNLGVTEGNSTHALFSPALYENKMALGAIYRASLAYHLEQQFGLEVERENGLIEVKGVPDDLMRAFSSRRQTIEQEMESRGWAGARAAAFVTLATRPPKSHVAQEVLLSHWQEMGQSYGFGTQEATHLLHSGQRHEHSPEQEKQEILMAVNEMLSAMETFTDADIVRAIAIEAPGRGIDRKGIETLWREFAHSEAVTRLSQSSTVRYVLTELPDQSHKVEHTLRSLSQETHDQEPEWEHLA